MKGLHTHANGGHSISFLQHEMSAAEGKVSFMTYMELRYLRWPKWLTFHFHTTSQFRIPKFALRISEFGIRNCEVYIIWASGNSQSTLEGVLNSQAKTKGSTT